MLSQPVPTDTAVSVPPPPVMAEMFRPVSLPAEMPVASTSRPCEVMFEAAPEVMVLTCKPSSVQVPLVQAVTVGATKLTPLIALAPAPEALIVGFTSRPLVVAVPVALLEPAVNAPFKRLALPEAAVANEVSVRSAASVVVLLLVIESEPEPGVMPVTPDRAPALMFRLLMLPVVGAVMAAVVVKAPFWSKYEVSTGLAAVL